jgi:hypothetical protein
MKDITYNDSFVPEGAPPTENYQGEYCLAMNVQTDILIKDQL